MEQAFFWEQEEINILAFRIIFVIGFVGGYGRIF